MNGADAGLVAAIVIFLAAAGVLAAAETSLTHVSRVRAIQLEDEGRRGAKSLLRLLEDPPRFLNIVLLLTLVVHFGGTSLATVLAERLTGDWAWVISTAGMTILVFVLAEAAPKTFAIQHADRVALRIAPIVASLVRFPGLHGFTRGLVRISNVVTPGKGLPRGPFITEQEIRTMAEVAAGEEAIQEEEKEMIHSIFEFGDTVVREVMVPRPDMVAVEKAAPLPDVLTQMLSHGFSRMPVYDGRDDNIIGLVYAKDVMRRLHNGGRRPGRLKDIVRTAIFVPESKNVADLLREMRTNKTHMAIVVDEYGEVSGLVTLEDLLEEIVGEIADEYDREEPKVQPIDERTLRVAGQLAIDDLSDLLDVELPDTEWDTVGGLLSGLLGKVPVEGDQVFFQGLSFRAERVQGRRITKVLITRSADERSRDPRGD